MATRVFLAGRGWCFYAKILGAIATKPKTSMQIAVELGGVRANPIRKIMRRLLDLKLVHVADWTRVGRTQKPVQLWSFGDGESAPMPLGRSTGMPLGNFTKSKPLRPLSEMIAFASIVRLLAEPHIRSEVADTLGLQRGSVRGVVNLMHSLGLVFIAGWEREAGLVPKPMFCIGVGRQDAKRPKPRTTREVRARYEQASNAKQSMLRITHALASNASVFHQAQVA